ncbi:MAG: response regulator [Melioribacteraceae bacterium]|nr:response regulator [Melioribacteraceae bacterium]
MEKKYKVVYAEDSKSISTSVRFVLLNAGFDVTHFENGANVVQEVQRIKPDIILLDNDMPVKDGFTILKELKSLDDIKHIPVIFFTTINDKLKVVERLAQGAADFIIKDSRAISELVPRIKKHLK